MSGATPDDDMPRDERLRAALRHAPDHEQAPPAMLAASIRAAARAGLRPAPREPRWAGLRQLWQSLGTPRPLWAGGAAALLVSVLTLQLWHDEPVPMPQAPPPPLGVPQAEAPAQQAVDAARAADPPATSATTPAAATAAAPAPAPAAGPAPAKARSDIEARRMAEPTPPARPQRPTDAAPRRLQETPGTMAESTSSAEPAARATQAAPAPLATAALPRTAPTAAVGTPAAPPAPRQAARAEAAVTAPEPSAAAGPVLPAPPRTLDTPAGEAARERAAQGKVGAAAPALAAATGATRNAMRDDATGAASVAVSRPPTLAAWLRALASGATSDMPAARLLQLLDAMAGARWLALPPPAPAAASQDSQRSWPAPQGGQVTLRLQAGGARWIEPDGRHWFVALDDAALLALRSAL